MLKDLKDKYLAPTLRQDSFSTKSFSTADFAQFKFATDPTTMKHMNSISSTLSSKLGAVLAELEGKGWEPRVAEGVRTVEEQAKKVRQGYSQTMKSAHLHGNAVDIVDARYGWNGPAANHQFEFWKDLNAAVKKVGLSSGGDWKNFKDPAHVFIR
jgi:peptidoglycan L-alanyl-D-glutamate endopeptidase CwlK